MKELAAYLLLVLGGQTPSADKIKEVLTSVGVETSDEELARLTTSLVSRAPADAGVARGFGEPARVCGELRAAAAAAAARESRRHTHETRGDVGTKGACFRST